jgi:arginine/lysine/ornithine decarboxylase
MERHINFEKASFHTPGHKGRLDELFASGTWLNAPSDLTELPGLDELSQPQGVLSDIEQTCSKIWGSSSTYLSVNGASAALMAAILAARELGDSILMPRNAHRAAIQAITLAGLTPIWYEPIWETSWGFWGSATVNAVEHALKEAQKETRQASRSETKANEQAAKVAALLVVSPTYQGALSDIEGLANLAHAHGVALIVDEAHGAHFVAGDKRSALTCGADAVAHSLHKTLPGLTQTGLVHLSKNSLLNPDSVRRSLNLLTSSSPSYLLLTSIERTAKYLASPLGAELLNHVSELKTLLEGKIKSAGALRIYANSNNSSNTSVTSRGTTPTHILVSPEQEEAANLYNFLIDRGIFPEAILGQGVLFMLGAGSQEKDVEILGQALIAFTAQEKPVSPLFSLANKTLIQKPGFEPVLTPDQALKQKTHVVARQEAQGQISAEIVCPCPPGIPVLIPGQKITEEVLELTENKQFTVIAN